MKQSCCSQWHRALLISRLSASVWALRAGSLCWHASHRESSVLVLLVPRVRFTVERIMERRSQSFFIAMGTPFPHFHSLMPCMNRIGYVTV